MSLDIWFEEDLSRAITSLSAANRKASVLALARGADWQRIVEDHAVYQSALEDVSLSFGLRLHWQKLSLLPEKF